MCSSELSVPTSAHVDVARTLVRTARMLDRVDSGLTLPQYRLLTLLDAGDERSTALAERLAVSKPAISTAVEVLACLGHVRRRSDDGDRRASWLQITDAGREALGRADRAYAERLAEVTGRMDDPSAFVSCFAAFASALDTDLSERRAGRRTPQPPAYRPPAPEGARTA
ncbi:hypothetical protein GCM10009841_23320 [Microlunatus panaciterrae]|uniref:DNA-binding MarR family transcriptional regulator n=1 Tax=Microlunatus panaciterrae TaxID=400768 RepID=A0ABS2RER0_9ACTN|nr:MarR family winged helix-turn-helix transcriptional regulator [Microlunatus panaciterrae]MBM7797213.1 DNA-binding MarR family transcriptional regulator [Microlunatus panaciterrae]